MARFIIDPNTGWPSVGLAPTTSTTSDWRIESKCCDAAPAPNVADRPNWVGEWQMREQLSMLLLRSATRANFCIRKISSLVQRDDDTAPTEVMPCSPWMRLNSPAA
jgi:hypothetical protein